MPDRKLPRRPDPKPEPEFEVVEDSGFEVVENNGFEVLDEAPPLPPMPPPVNIPTPPNPQPALSATPSRAAPKPAPAPASKVVAKPVRAEVAEERATAAKPAAKSAARSVRPEVAEDEPPRPAKPKKKKKRRPDPVVDEDQESRDQVLREFEWIWPTILLAFGMVLTFVGAFGVAKTGAFTTIGVMVIGLFVSIPVTIAVLMIVGIVLGIEYGRLGPAILKLAAITFVVNGIFFIGDWARLPSFVVFPVACGISFGLFMAQFDLDTWETNASVGALNVMTFVANIVIIGFLVVATDSVDDKKKKGDYEDDDVPADVRPGPRGKNGQPPPMTDPDDDPDLPDDDPE